MHIAGTKRRKKDKKNKGYNKKYNKISKDESK